MAAATDGSEYMAIDLEGGAAAAGPFVRADSVSRTEHEDEELLWAAIERLPSSKRLNYAILRKVHNSNSSSNDDDERGASSSSSSGARPEAVDVTNLDREGRQMLVQNALATNEQDNYNLLAGIKARLDRVGLEVPTVEVRFHELNVSANVYVGDRALPSLPNFTRNAFEMLLTSLRILRPKKHSLTILDNVSGVVKPGRMTLLLGPPGAGKSTLLLALAGKLDSNLKVTGQVKYNGKFLDEFFVQRTSAYISQTDNHIGELTVRETLDFAARCQGANDNFSDLARLEKERNVRPTPEIDAFMKATSVVGKKHSLATDYILKVLGLDVCADTQVTSKKDQAQYWSDQSRPYVYIPASGFSEAFKQSEYGKSVDSSLSAPNDATKFLPSALARTKFALSNLDLIKACFSREVLLIKRHRFLYIFRTCQVAVMGIITCTMFPRTRLHPLNEINGNLYLNCLFYGMVHMMFNGFSELPITISRLPVFYKQRDNHFHPAWAFSIPSWLLRIPYSIIESLVWSCVVYYAVGFAPSAGRFFCFMLLLFCIHQMALGLFRLMGALARDMIIANTFGSATLLAIFLLGGFIIPKHSIRPWWVWGFWISPLTYGQRAISVNEFTASRWAQISLLGNSTSVGTNILHSHSLPDQQYWYWLGVGVLFSYSILFNILVALALAYLNPLGKAQAVITPDAAGKKPIGLDVSELTERKVAPKNISEKGMILPFQPLAMTFHNVNYFVDMPKEMKRKGVPESKLQLLSSVSGVFRPGVLTALVGSSGAGKTTLMDVLAGRKTGGYIEGDIKISGYPKEQSTFARVSGYVEQNDIHSPQVTVEESLWFSARLRLPKEIRSESRHDFVEQVMALVELDNLRHALVGLPGSTGLSTEQRKRLTIAVELVANPSIIFMDEPTSGLDARAAAIVMRTVRNTVDTGRTVICTIHQPSIDIFETFDELLLMKRGGQVIYGGALGTNSQIMINYFQGIHGIPPITDGYNPATWMLEISTPACEKRLDIDFATVYKNSDQFREVEALIHQLSRPVNGTQPLRFSSKFSQDTLSQFRICYWKQNLVYWRSPKYNAVRLFFTTISALILGSVFWNVGSRRETNQDLFVVMGALYSACLFLGVNNASSVQPIISIERAIFYREKAARMYSSFPYAAAQGLVEIPYIATQTLIFGVITYFMINYERTLGKFLLYLVFMFLTFTYFTFYGIMAIGLTPTQHLALTFTYFTFYGIMAIGLTPTQHLAAVISSTCYSLWNLLSGFLIPKPRIPKWWLWFYYLSPVSWTLRGIITSQLGDVETPLVGAGFKGSVKEYLKESLDYESGMTAISVVVLACFSLLLSLDYESGMTAISVVVLACFSLLFFTVYAMSIRFLNFQKR
ncbi:uncharacterized protein A4U43_C02F40 [Asparagus officinalis]|uniref:ABC transporter domain-containing protein n=1 Tax=Asparagus officinalis TaxID=4686 RepID=A0A5P1FHB3_ASPOF|nr:uncharacterized protein A4U43_C02F40 [Asparagus officinalis]